jgi:hypothetical protein
MEVASASTGIPFVSDSGVTLAGRHGHVSVDRFTFHQNTIYEIIPPMSPLPLDLAVRPWHPDKDRLEERYERFREAR